MANQIRLALIGCGGIAQTHLEAIAKVPRIKLEIIQDIHKAAADVASAKYGCKATTSLDDVFKMPEIDAVLICVPPAFHFEIVKKAIDAGKHILCEKPFTTKLSDAEEIKKLSQKTDKLIMMASKFRFVQDVIEAKKLVQAGVIGEIVLTEVIFCSIVDMTKRWNSDPAIAGGGVLIDNGSHAVDVIRYLVGPIKSVYAQEGKKAQNIRVDDTARLHFETEDRIIGMVDLSWGLYKHTPNFVNILGTLGTIEIGWAQSQVWDAKTKTSKVYGNGYKKLDAFVNQMEHFADCIQKKASPILGIDDAIESVRVIETAYTSIREKKWLKLL
jgi:predicted dehydrogenase